MAMSFDKALGLHEAVLKLRVERASVLSSNLANVDTPNYKARDLDFHAVLNQQLHTQELNNQQGRMISTNEGHQGNGGVGRPESDFFYRTPSQPSVDGNTVDESIEHAEYSKNSMEFQIAFTLLNSKFKGLSKAIKGE